MIRFDKMRGLNQTLSLIQKAVRFGSNLANRFKKFFEIELEFQTKLEIVVKNVKTRDQQWQKFSTNKLFNEVFPTKFVKKLLFILFENYL